MAERGGLGWSSLVHVDGVTVAKPVLEALEQGLHENVSMLFESVQCEEGNHDAPPISDAGAYLRRRLAGFAGAAAADSVARRYIALAGEFAQLGAEAPYAVTAMSGDSAVACGTLALASAAARGAAVRGGGGAFVGTLVRGPARGVRDGGCEANASRLQTNNDKHKT